MEKKINEDHPVAVMFFIELAAVSVEYLIVRLWRLFILPFYQQVAPYWLWASLCIAVILLVLGFLFRKKTFFRKYIATAICIATPLVIIPIYAHDSGNSASVTTKAAVQRAVNGEVAASDYLAIEDFFSVPEYAEEQEGFVYSVSADAYNYSRSITISPYEVFQLKIWYRNCYDEETEVKFFLQKGKLPTEFIRASNQYNPSTLERESGNYDLGTFSPDDEVTLYFNARATEAGEHPVEFRLEEAGRDPMYGTIYVHVEER